MNLRTLMGMTCGGMFAALAMFPISSAAADGCNCGAIQSMINSATTSINGRIDLMENSLVEMLKQGFASVVGTVAKQTKAMEGLTDAQIASNREDIKVRARAEAESWRFQDTADACYPATAKAAMAPGRRVIGSFDTQSATNRRSWTSGDMTSATGGARAEAVDFRAQTRARYGRSSDLQVKDFDVDGRAISPATGTYSQAQIPAAEAYLRNIIDPSPARKPTDEEIARDKSIGPAYDAYVARMNVANEAVRPLLALRAPTMALGGWANGAVGQRKDGTPYPNEISWRDVMDVEVERRNSVDWEARMAAAPDTAIIREVNRQLAISNSIAWQVYQRLESLVAIGAVQIAREVEKDAPIPLPVTNP